jgi:hypothetical protein
MKLRIIVLLLGMVVSAPIASDNTHARAQNVGSDKTYVSHNCTGMKIEPRRILFACGDGNFFVTKLNWGSWHKRRAVGWGKFHQNDCDPFCAEGEFHTRKGRLVLRGRMYCADKDKYSYARAKIRYRKRLLGKKRESFKLFCPL